MIVTGKANEHNVLVPRDHWLEPWEKVAIISFHHQFPLEGYRRRTFMMLDRDEVGHLTLKHLSGAQSCWAFAALEPKACCIGNCAPQMTELDVEIILQRARERYPDSSPRITTDNGPQFIVKDFKEFTRLAGLTHVRTSPYHPQSNGNIEPWHRNLKLDCLRPGWPLSQEEAARLIERFVTHYNTVRLHSAIGYIAPADRLAGPHLEIFSEPDRKLELARQNRQTKRQSLTKSIIAPTS